MENINLAILMNMMENGTIQKNENINTEMVSLNKDYIIEFHRRNLSLYNNQSYQYRCEIIFKNNINVELLRIVLSEDDIIRLLDSVYSYMEFNMSDINIYFNSYTSNFNGYYIFNFKNINDNIQFYINIFDYKYQKLYQKLNIKFDIDTLNHFLELLYFTFLIDLDNPDSLLVNPFYLM